MSKPKPTGKVCTTDITDAASPFFNNEQPAFVSVQGDEEDAQYILVFTQGAEYLEAYMKQAGLPYDKIVRIMDGNEFLNSIPKEIKIAVNPFFHENGNVRWTEIQR